MKDHPQIILPEMVQQKISMQYVTAWRLIMIE